MGSFASCLSSQIVCVPAIVQRPWVITVAHSVNARLPAHILPAAPSLTTNPVQDVVSLHDGTFGAWGLLLASRVTARVTLPFDMTPPGWGQRSLTPRELASVWDAPILWQDEYVKRGWEPELRHFVASAPARVLSGGVDYFFTTFPRGGSCVVDS